MTRISVALDPLLFTVSGSVQYQSEAISDVTVTFKASDITTTSDSIGSFEFSDIRYGSFVIVFYHDLYESQELLVNIISSESLGLIMLNSKPFSLTVTVTDGTTGSPLPDALVLLSQTGGDDVGPLFSNDCGLVVFDDVYIGCYSLEVNLDGYDGKVELNVEVQGDCSVSINLDPLVFSLTGRVLGTGPVEDVNVTISSSQSTLTASDGTFQLDNVLYGRQLLVFQHNNYQTYELVVDLNSDSNVGDVELEFRVFSVYGFIVNEGGHRLEGVVISKDAVEMAVSNSDGFFLFLLPSGIYTLEFTYDEDSQNLDIEVDFDDVHLLKLFVESP
ncbi:hypothetical protein GEMRC1_014209 [Eukaryota sp. GEM-RC1]